ncbi:MAG TPA: hypothetical protein VMS74_03975 [Acidimicrobiia bacterium]|nr:hypothetical protein [Acidimicrobiia bacterium]
MNLATIPLLIVALLLLSSTHPEVDSVELVLTGPHQVDDQTGALIIGSAEVTVPADGRLSGPIYVIGGELVVEGAIDLDVTQLAGTVTIAPGAVIAGELHHIGGTQVVSDTATIGRQTTLVWVPADEGPIAGYLPMVALVLLLALVGSRLTRKRSAALGNVADAIAHHPVVTVTVGALLTLTFIAVFVFMAFTLILIPVAVIGGIIGLVTVAYGVIGWGHLLGRRLSHLSQSRATALGVTAFFVLVELVSWIPLVGDLAVIGALGAGLGAVVLTYYGATRFKPEALPD